MQESVLVDHCRHTRFVWNLAWSLNQFGERETYGEAVKKKDRDGNSYIHQKKRPVRKLPNYVAQARMLTEARQEFDWLRDGVASIQQQALRDFDQAMNNFHKGTHGYPKRKKKFKNEGFRVVLPMKTEKLNRHWSQVWVPKVGWVRFQTSRPVPEGVKSFRVTRDGIGRWHVAFAHIPESIPAPGNGETVGVDRGVTITVALSDGRKLRCPQLSRKELTKRKKHERRAARTKKDSPERAREWLIVNKIRAKEVDRRKDWVEKTSTDLAREFDLITFEDLKIKNMTRSAAGTIENPGKNVAQKRGLNRVILSQGWGMLRQRTEDKAPGRVERINPKNTSLRCNECGWIAKENRESQAVFSCVNCGYTINADSGAGVNIDRAGVAQHGLAAGQAGNSPPITIVMRRMGADSSVREPQVVGL